MIMDDREGSESHHLHQDEKFQQLYKIALGKKKFAKKNLQSQ